MKLLVSNKIIHTQTEYGTYERRPPGPANPDRRSSTGIRQRRRASLVRLEPPIRIHVNRACVTQIRARAFAILATQNHPTRDENSSENYYTTHFTERNSDSDVSGRH